MTGGTKKGQKAKASDGSQITQVNGDVNISLTVAESRESALAIGQSDLDKYTNIAQKVAIERNEHLVDKLLAALGTHDPEKLALVIKDPDFQWAIAQAKIAYARTGKSDDLLVDLLTTRANETEDTIRKIALDESVATIAKLTKYELSALAFIFITKHTISFQVFDDESFSSYLDNNYTIFVDKLPVHASSYQHLNFANCGTIGIGSSDFVDIMRKRYPGAFIQELDVEQLEILKNELDDSDLYNSFIGESGGVPYLKIYNKAIINNFFDRAPFYQDKEALIERFLDKNLMNKDKSREKILALSPGIENVLRVWEESYLKNFTLSSVGIAIGHAEHSRISGDISSLETWLK